MQVGKKYPSRFCSSEEVITGNSQVKWAKEDSDKARPSLGPQLAVMACNGILAKQPVYRGRFLTTKNTKNAKIYGGANSWRSNIRLR